MPKGSTHKYKSWQHEDDRDTWKAFKNGDRHALEYIYRSNVKALYNYGMKIYHCSEVVKDCIQELIIDLWRQKNQLNHTDNIHFYLIKALRWKILRFLESKKRSDRRNNLHAMNYDIEVTLPYESQMIDEQVCSEKKKKLHDLLDKLPARQKEVIHLLFFKKFSYEEISEIMSLNLRSVYTLAWKAVSSLRKHMSDFFVFILFAPI